ncbi:WD40 repeat domain-containing protein [Paraburkholderia sp. MM5482-R1]|uniref:WD40 repeat domain-containing protein n=1 Tax=unclassified Paraburkholderia TaxID=2615204 RepID=UPI003D198B89
MTEPDHGWQSAQGDGIAQAYGPGASASVEIHHHYPASSPVSLQWPRPWDFSGYISEKRTDFTGRDWLFDEVRAWYDDNAGAQALLICADYGVGKSAFMAELTCNTRGLRIAAGHFCHHDTAETLNPATFVRSVAAQLANTLPEYRSVVQSNPDARRWLDDVQVDPGSAFERAVIGPLNAIKLPAGPQVLLVDALDEALDFEGNPSSSAPITIVRLLASRARRLPGWLRLLATSRRRLEVLQPIKSSFKCEMLDAEDSRNLDDIRHYVTSRCAGGALSRVLEGGNKSADEIATLLSSANQGGGKFLYAVMVLNDVERGVLPLDRLKGLPPGLDGFYLDAFQRRFAKEENFQPVGALLGVLCVQREPLSRAELAAILNMSEARIAQMLRRFEDFLRIRSKRYSFDHLSLAQWLSEETDEGFPRADRFSVAPEDSELLIAAWARRELAAGRAHDSRYLARHLAAYLSPQERTVHFTKLLLDFRWLEARLRAAGVKALLMDFADVERTPAAMALERALRHGAHVFGHDDNDWPKADLLASQLLGRLQSQIDPEVRALCAQAAGQLVSSAGLRPLTESLRSAEALLRTFEGHTEEVTALASLGDSRLASGAGDNTIRLWNLESGVCEATLRGHTARVTGLVVLPDGRLASGSWDGTIKLWNRVSCACQKTFEGHTQFVSALLLLADGRLASGSWDNTIRLWDPAGNACQAVFQGHMDRVNALAALADGRLASASDDGTVRLWNLASRVCEAKFEEGAPVSELAVLGDGRLALASADGSVRLLNPTSGGEVRLEAAGAMFALAAVADGRLAAASDDHVIRVWNPTSGACEVSLEGHIDRIRTLVVLTDGRLVSASDDRTIKLWNLARGPSDAAGEGHAGSVCTLAALSDGRFASGSSDDWDDPTISIWNSTSGACEEKIEGHTEEVTALAVLADGRLASAAADLTVKLWNPTTGACEATFQRFGATYQRFARVTALAVLADGRLVSSSDHDWIKVWDLADDIRLSGRQACIDNVFALAVLADGRLASGSYDKKIRLWDPEEFFCVATLRGHSDLVSALAVLPDGRLASGSNDKTVRLWNPESGECQATLEGHTEPVSALAALPGGRLASGSVDKTIRVWQEDDGRWTGSVGFVAEAKILSLAFSGCAKVLAAGDSSGRVHFLKVEPRN